MAISGNAAVVHTRVYAWVSNYGIRENRKLQKEMQIVNKFGETIFAMLNRAGYGEYI